MAIGSNCMAPNHGNTVNADGKRQAKPVKIQNTYRGGLILVSQVGGNAQPSNGVDNSN